jgi:hypothetical protein
MIVVRQTVHLLSLVETCSLLAAFKSTQVPGFKASLRMMVSQ